MIRQDKRADERALGIDVSGQGGRRIMSKILKGSDRLRQIREASEGCRGSQLMNDGNAKQFAGNVKIKLLIVTSYCQARSGRILQSHSDGQNQHPDEKCFNKKCYRFGIKRFTVVLRNLFVVEVALVPVRIWTWGLKFVSIQNIIK